MAAAGLAPTLLAKANAPATPAVTKSVTLRPEARAVARQEGSL